MTLGKGSKKPEIEGKDLTTLELGLLDSVVLDEEARNRYIATLESVDGIVRVEISLETRRAILTIVDNLGEGLPAKDFIQGAMDELTIYGKPSTIVGFLVGNLVPIVEEKGDELIMADVRNMLNGVTRECDKVVDNFDLSLLIAANISDEVNTKKESSLDNLVYKLLNQLMYQFGDDFDRDKALSAVRGLGKWAQELKSEFNRTFISQTLAQLS